MPTTCSPPEAYSFCNALSCRIATRQGGHCVCQKSMRRRRPLRLRLNSHGWPLRSYSAKSSFLPTRVHHGIGADRSDSDGTAGAGFGVRVSGADCGTGGSDSSRAGAGGGTTALTGGRTPGGSGPLSPVSSRWGTVTRTSARVAEVSLRGDNGPAIVAAGLSTFFLSGFGVV